MTGRVDARPVVFSRRRTQMEQDDRDFSPDAWEERIEVAYRRMQQALPALPWLPRVMNLKRLRRQVRRARAGVIEPENPHLTAKAWADTLEQGIELNLQEIRQERWQAEEAVRREAEQQQAVLDYNRRWMEVYRRLKQLPEAADPNSEVAAQITAMKKELRKLRGRPRRRRRR
jgi:hypothetical protein